jgi:hypothetical protein
MAILGEITKWLFVRTTTMRTTRNPEVVGLRLFLPWALMIFTLGSCYGPGERMRCSTNAECNPGVCNVRGFCHSECRKDIDCPCGSRCTTCGVCLTVVGHGPATCFARDNGFTADELRGACHLPPGADGGAEESCEVPACLEVDAGPAAADAPPEGAIDAEGDL